MQDFRQAPLSEDLQALGEYSLKLTLTPWEMGQEDVDTLRTHGFTDEQILNANLVASYFNFINRVADGLGVDLEDWMTNESETGTTQSSGEKPSE